MRTVIVVLAVVLCAGSVRAGGTGKGAGSQASRSQQALLSAMLKMPVAPQGVVPQLRQGRGLTLKVLGLPADLDFEEDAKQLRVYLFTEEYYIQHIDEVKKSSRLRKEESSVYRLKESEAVLRTSIDARHMAKFHARKLRKHIDYDKIYVAIVCGTNFNDEATVGCNPTSPVTVVTTRSTEPDPQLARFMVMTPEDYFNRYADDTPEGFDVFEDYLIEDLKEAHVRTSKYLNLIDAEFFCNGLAEKFFGFVDTTMSRLDRGRGLIMTRCLRSIDRLLLALQHPCYESMVDNPGQLDVFMKGWHSCGRVDDVFGLLRGDLLKGMWRSILYPGWHATAPMSFSWEKEGKDLAIMNDYRPSYVDPILYAEMCRQGKDSEKELVARYTTKGYLHVKGDRSYQKPGDCVPSWWDEMCGSLPCKHHFFKDPSGADVVVKEVLQLSPRGDFVEETGHPLLKLHMCVHFQEPKDALSCVERLIRRGLTSNQGDIDLGARLVDGLNAMYAGHIVKACVHVTMARESIEYVQEHEPELRLIPDFIMECIKPDIHAIFAEYRNADRAIVVPAESEKLLEDFLHWTVAPMVHEELSNVKASGDVDGEHEYEIVARWTDYVRANDDNYFLSKTLDQELAESTWEMKHDRCEGVVGMAMLQILRMQRGLGNTKNLHFHVVFERPDSNCCDGGNGGSGCAESCDYKDEFERKERRMLWEDNRELAALVTHVNDYAAFKSYASNVHTKFLSVFDTDEVAELKEVLADGGTALQGIESMSDGHNWGAFKEAFVALRAGIYGHENLVGIEVRGGVSPLFTEQQLKLKADGSPSEYYYTLTNVIRLILEFPMTNPGRLKVRLSPEENLKKHRWVKSVTDESSDEEAEWPDSPRLRDSEYDGLDAEDPFEDVAKAPAPVITLQDISTFQENNRRVGYRYFGTSSRDDAYCDGDCIRIEDLYYPKELVELALKITVDYSIQWQSTSLPKGCAKDTGKFVVKNGLLDDPAKVTMNNHVAGCVMVMFTRWSFAMLNLRSWARLLYKMDSDEDLSELKFSLGGREYSYADATRDFIMEKFFRDPRVKSCGLTETDPDAGTPCYKFLCAFISRLDTKEYLREKF